MLLQVALSLLLSASVPGQSACGLMFQVPDGWVASDVTTAGPMGSCSFKLRPSDWEATTSEDDAHLTRTVEVTVVRGTFRETAEWFKFEEREGGRWVLGHGMVARAIERPPWWGLTIVDGGTRYYRKSGVGYIGEGFARITLLGNRKRQCVFLLGGMGADEAYDLFLATVRAGAPN